MTVTDDLRTITEDEYAARPTALDAGRLDNRSMFGPNLPTLAELEALALRLQVAGYRSERGDAFAHLQALASACEAARVEHRHEGGMEPFFAGLEPASLDVADVGPALHYAALVRQLQDAPRAWLDTAADAFVQTLRPHALAAFVEHASAVVPEMSSGYDQAAQAVVDAHQAGILPTTTAAHLADTGTPAQLKTWRALSEAVAALDRIADLRVRLFNALEQPLAESGAAIATLVDTEDEDREQAALKRDGAANLYNGLLERVFVRSNRTNVGPSAGTMASPRTGGAWLALVAAGYRLRLAPLAVAAR